MLEQVVDVFGRGAHVQGLLHDSGGTSNDVSVYYGLSDGGTNPLNWDNFDTVAR